MAGRKVVAGWAAEHQQHHHQHNQHNQGILPQVDSSQVESIGSVWPAEDALPWAKARFAGGLEMKLQSAGCWCCSCRC